METLYVKKGNKYVVAGTQTHLDMYPGLWLVEATKSGSRMQALRIGDAPVLDITQSALIKMILEYVAEYINHYKLGTLSEDSDKFTFNEGYEIAYNIYSFITSALNNEIKHNQEAYEQWFKDYPKYTPDERHTEVVLRAFDRIIKEFEDDSPRWHGVNLTNLHRLLDAINSETYKLIGTPFYNQLMHLLKTHFKEYCVIKQIIK